jgi:hypothetical protein
VCRGFRPRNGYFYRFSKANPSFLNSHAAKTECKLDFWTILLCLMIFHLKKPRIWKNQVCHGHRPRNDYYYRFSKEIPSSLSSPAIRTYCGARLLDYFIVFEDCTTKKARNLGKTQVYRGYRPRNGYYYRFSKENPRSLSSPAVITECVARLLDFFFVFDDFAIKEAGTLKKI